jgi:hypothetical protein
MAIKYETIPASELRDGDVILPWNIDEDETLVNLIGRFRVRPDGISNRPKQSFDATTGEVEHLRVVSLEVAETGRYAGIYEYANPQTDRVRIEPRP